jgi:hypothetical protein
LLVYVVSSTLRRNRRAEQHGIGVRCDALNERIGVRLVEMLCDLQALNEIEFTIELKALFKVRRLEVRRIYQEPRAIDIGPVEAHDIADALFLPLS